MCVPLFLLLFSAAPKMAEKSVVVQWSNRTNGGSSIYSFSRGAPLFVSYFIQFSFTAAVDINSILIHVALFRSTVQFSS